MANNNPVVQGSRVVKSPKMQLFPNSPLIGILKPEYYEIIDPYTYSVEDTSGSLPSDTGLIITPGDGLDDGSGEETDNTEIALEETFLEAPNLEDILGHVVEKYTDLNGVDKLKITFTVRNHVGPAVIGVKGYGG